MILEGKKVNLKSPQDPLKSGIGMVHQEFSLIPGFTVSENIVLNRESLAYNPLVESSGPRLSTLDRDDMTRRAMESIKKLDIALSPDTLISELPVGHK